MSFFKKLRNNYCKAENCKDIKSRIGHSQTTKAISLERTYCLLIKMKVINVRINAK